MSTTNEAASVHGHAVLDLIHELAPPPTVGELARETELRFGPDARFHTCSQQGMTLNALLQFLLARQKVELRDGRLFVRVENVCKH